MTVRPVNLSVHRNTRDQRRRREVMKDLVSDAKVLTREMSLDGYAIIAWDKNGNESQAYWRMGSISCNFMPEFAKGVLSRKISMIDASDMILGIPPEKDGA